MMHLYSTIPFIILATAIVVLLAKSDTRRKQQHQKAFGEAYGLAVSSKGRKMLAWCLLLPVIVLSFQYNVAGVLIYFGALTVLGWVISALPTRWV